MNTPAPTGAMPIIAWTENETIFKTMSDDCLVRNLHQYVIHIESPCTQNRSSFLKGYYLCQAEINSRGLQVITNNKPDFLNTPIKD